MLTDSAGPTPRGRFRAVCGRRPGPGARVGGLRRDVSRRHRRRRAPGGLDRPHAARSPGAPRPAGGGRLGRGQADDGGRRAGDDSGDPAQEERVLAQGRRHRHHRADPGDQRRHGVPDDGLRSGPQPAPARALPRDDVGERRDAGDPDQQDRPVRPGRSALRRRRRHRARRAGPRHQREAQQRPRRAGAVPGSGAHAGRARVVRGGQVHADQPAGGQRAAARPRKCATPIIAGSTPRRIAS